MSVATSHSKTLQMGVPGILSPPFGRSYGPLAAPQALFFCQNDGGTPKNDLGNPKFGLAQAFPELIAAIWKELRPFGCAAGAFFVCVCCCQGPKNARKLKKRVLFSVFGFFEMEPRTLDESIPGSNRTAHVKIYYISICYYI